jgi:hypothetical protein
MVGPSFGLRGVSAEVVPGVGADPLLEFGFSPAGVGPLGRCDRLALAPAFGAETRGAVVGNPKLYFAEISGAHFVASGSDPLGTGSFVHALHVAGVMCVVKTSRDHARAPIIRSI